MINCDDNIILKLPGPADDVEDAESLYSADYKIRQLTKSAILVKLCLFCYTSENLITVTLLKR